MMKNCDYYNARLLILIVQCIGCLIIMQWGPSLLAWLLLGWTILTTGLSFYRFNT